MRCPGRRRAAPAMQPWSRLREPTVRRRARGTCGPVIPSLVACAGHPCLSGWAALPPRCSARNGAHWSTRSLRASSGSPSRPPRENGAGTSAAPGRPIRLDLPAIQTAEDMVRRAGTDHRGVEPRRHYPSEARELQDVVAQAWNARKEAERAPPDLRQPVDPEEDKRLVCEAATRLGMVWPSSKGDQ